MEKSFCKKIYSVVTFRVAKYLAVRFWNFFTEYRGHTERRPKSSVLWILVFWFWFWYSLQRLKTATRWIGRKSQTATQGLAFGQNWCFTKRNWYWKHTEKELYIKDQLLAKHYIIDTNVFVDCPEILSKIDIKHNVVLSARVIDELDKLKRKLKDVKKENAEKALKLINQKLGKKKGNIRTARADLRLLPVDFNDKSPDNLILCVALMYKDKNPFLLTSYNGLQAKAKICDIPTISLRDFLYGKVKLPINTQTGVMIDRQILIDAYNSKKKRSVTFSEFNSALNNTIKGFSYRQYGLSKFKDFCNSLSEIFDIQLDEKGVECLILK